MAYNKNELIQKIQSLDLLSIEEKSSLIDLLRSHKKYGLVWENKPEDVEERLRIEIPVLKEVKERTILCDDPTAPNHILIEGDNLDALVALSYTHSGKIDVIYIDPPYNTGNKDFVYNDSYVDSEDSYRHSKWLSFLDKRLKISKTLMSDKGLIFISIDDNEISNLKLLCDAIFGESNCIGVLPTVMNLKGNQDQFGFAGTHEYTVVYAKSTAFCSIGQLDIDEEGLEDWLEDEVGYYKKGATLKRTGIDAPRERRPYCYFPIMINNHTLEVSTITEEEYHMIFNPSSVTFDDEYVSQLVNKYSSKGYSVLLPSIDGVPTSWRWGYRTVKTSCQEIIVTGSINNYSLYKKQRPELGDLPTKKPKSILYKAQYSSGNGTSQLKTLSLANLFSYPKPIDLIIDLLKIGGGKDSTILDFFAGSGTTLHATMQLNAEDGGHRKCILVTNNENGICENVTYVRNKKVIRGYKTPKGEVIEGLKNNNLRYFKTKFVDREQTSRNMRALMEASIELLCIKNDLYAEVDSLLGKKLNKKVVRYFDNGEKRMLVVFKEEAIPAIAEEISKMEYSGRMMVYVFSPGNYAFEDEFVDVLDRVELCALPSAIYNAYLKVLPKKRNENDLNDLLNENDKEA
ncbi:MAG: site-specific DNA-methyltransferase [Bacteroidales bacterium]|nr:site-specific DNA-methyltransferase [Bacteroidales bacterium]